MSEKVTSYNTIREKSESKYKEKGSIFLAFAHPVETTAQFEELLAGYRKQFYDAVHHCPAFRLIDGTFKYSDDGEPSGTAGLRIFNAIEHRGLNNIAVIVVRHFGGVKLGVGPLGKAYYATALEALDNSKVITLHQSGRYLFNAPYELSSFLYRQLSVNGVKIISSDYAGGITLDVWIKATVAEGLVEEVVTLANGQVEVLATGETKFFPEDQT